MSKKGKGECKRNHNKVAARLFTEPRTCLRCSREFFSTGPGNRICSSCHNDKTPGIKNIAVRIRTTNSRTV